MKARLRRASPRTGSRASPIGIGLIVLTPGVRVASVAACGIADVWFRTFLPGLILGEGLFLCLHFFIGALLVPGLAAIAQIVPPTIPVIAIIVVVISGCLCGSL
jgi:hypothetical protein